MHKMILMTELMFLGCMANAAPGFIKAVFTGSAFNGTADIWTYSAATVVEDLEDVYKVRTDFPQTTTYAYGTYMQLEGGVDYYFATQFDDHSSLKIDNALVIPTGGEVETRYGIIRFKDTGWHRIELRFSNNGGAGGNQGYQYGGVRVKKGTSGSWQKIQNNSEGTLCVTEPPAEYDEPAPDYAYGWTTYSSAGVTRANLIKCGAETEVLSLPDQLAGYNIGKINDACFSGDTVLKKIVKWPLNLTAIGNKAFYGCTSLEEMSIPELVSTIGNNAFGGCSSLKKVELPNTLKTLEDNTFAECANLRDVTLPDELQNIKYRVFYKCVALEKIEFPDMLLYVGREAFQYCSSLKSIHHPKSVTYIGQAAYECCETLESVNIPDGITELYAYTFQYDYKLASIELPSSIQKLGANVFRYCTALTDLTIPSGVKELPTDMCSECTALKTVKCEGDITIIGNYAFRDCSSLQSFAVPRTVLSIGKEAFRMCSKVDTIELPDGLQTIGGAAFFGCNFTHVDIPDSVMTIGDDAFRDCAKLESLTLPRALKKIPCSFAWNCLNLRAIEIPDSVTVISDRAFQNVPLEEIVLPDGLLSIGCYAFCNCKYLTKIDIPPSVSYIGHEAFCGCSALERVSGCEGLETIGFWAFSGCTKLKSFVFPESFSTFEDHDYCGYSPFAGCSNIDIVFKGDVPENMSYFVNSFKNQHVWWPQKYGKSYLCTLRDVWSSCFAGYAEKFGRGQFIISSSIRKSDPTILDVVYTVPSKNPTVKVRVLAFEDGERSFAKVVRPETFVDGTEVNVGDNVTPNVTNTISWRVSADWQKKLAKVAFEVLVCEGELLPLELMTIPASDQYGKIKISWNAISNNQALDALFWMYADKSDGMSCVNGVLKDASTQLANGSTIFAENAMTYIYDKMGYNRLSGKMLSYANSETRLGLVPSGARQYAYKIVEQ